MQSEEGKREEDDRKKHKYVKEKNMNNKYKLTNRTESETSGDREVNSRVFLKVTFSIYYFFKPFVICVQQISLIR